MFLKKSREAMTDKNSMIFVKENIKTDGFDLDNTDNSVTRPIAHYQALFE